MLGLGLGSPGPPPPPPASLPHLHLRLHGHHRPKDFDGKVQDFITAYFTMNMVERWVNAAIIAPLTGLFMALMTVVLVAMRDVDFG